MSSAPAVEIITPVGQIGYGYPITPFVEECRRMPDGSFIIADAGSTDSGPQKLCFGLLTAPREAYLRDLRPILQMAHERGFKVLFGSVGGHGSNQHVDIMTDIVRGICEAEGYTFNVAKIYAEVDHDLIKSNIKRGLITPCGPVPELTVEEVDKSPRVVAQMGVEPFIEALKGGADIVLAGRAYDPSPYAAVCQIAGIDPGIGWHMGKASICECGALCATPRGKSIRATVRKDGFDLTPVNVNERCVPISVAAHTLYEKSRPDLLPGPGGILDLNHCTYTAVNDRTTRVSGAIFRPQPYTVKLEGAKPIGFRAIVVAGIKDPILTHQIDSYLGFVRKTVFAMMDDFDPKVDRLAWHVYGKNGVMGDLESPDTPLAHELLVMAEVLSNTQDRAKWIGNRLRVALLHTPYPGQMATSGNVAFPYAPFETPIGQFSEFNVYHIMPIDDPLALFPIHYEQMDYSTNHLTNGHINGHANGNGIPNGHVHESFNGDKPKVDPYSAVAKEIAAWCASAKPKPTFSELVQSGRKTATISELARFVRSKNAGPYEVTFDVMFAEEAEYQWMKQAGVLEKTALAKLYNTDPEKVVTCMFFDPARAFKFTIPRPRVQAGFGETDMHAAQEYMPIARLEVPLPEHL